MVCRAGEAGQQSRVQAVDAFQNDELAFFELHDVAGLAAAEVEAELGQLDFLAGNQLLEVGLEPGGVEGFERFKLVSSLFVFGRLLPVEEVIIQLEREGRNALGQELDREALGKSGFARRRRPGNQHDAGLLGALHHQAGNFGDAMLVESLGDENQFADPLGLDGAVQRAHAVDPQPHQPIIILPERGQELLGIRQRRQFIRRLAARETAGRIRHPSA